MRRIADQTTLIIVGAWNPAILNPAWVARNALGMAPDANFEVGVNFVAVDPTRQFRFSFSGIDFSPMPGALIFHLNPLAPADCERALTAAAAILRLLPHTPISGYGMNFAYSADDVSEQIAELFRGANLIGNGFHHDEAQVVASGCSASVSLETRVFNIQAQLTGGQARFDVNVHASVNSAEAAAEALGVNGLFQRTQNEVLALIGNLTGEELHNEQ
jgi:hypothetical protein